MSVDEAPLSQVNAAAAVVQDRDTYKKYSFNLYPSDLAKLRDLNDWGVGTNITQALRAAIDTEHYLQQAARNNERVVLEGPDGNRREIVFAGRLSAASARA